MPKTWCLPKQAQINKYGYIDNNKKKKKNNLLDYIKQKEESMNTKEKAKKNKKTQKKKKLKYKKKIAKRLKNEGLSDKEIAIRLENIDYSAIVPSRIGSTNNSEDSGDEENVFFEDILQRPVVSSVPKYTLAKESNELETDFNIKEYSMNLNYYSKEKNRFNHDEGYRKELIRNKKLLDNAKDDHEKQKIFNKNKNRGINEDVKVKLVDLGNACWFKHHFSTIIQTRQYRSPEVIIGQKYNETADMWSFACMIYELITGDFLFEPSKGESWSKNDEHLAEFIELLGPMPRKMIKAGRYSKVRR